MWKNVESCVQRVACCTISACADLPALFLLECFELIISYKRVRLSNYSVLLFAGVKRVPLYIPPPMPEDEEHIFETIQKGINFDKYDMISVECTGQDALTERDTIRRLLFCFLAF